jgi:iodotyrosine deiodinase
MSAHQPIPLDFTRLPESDMRQRSAGFLALMRRRRSVRMFAPDAPPRQVIEDALLTAGSAPSGANLQPWQFVVVESAALRNQIRVAAEAEEREFYNGRAPQEWLDALAPLGTDADKSFLDVAPVLIAIFAKGFDLLPDGRKVKNYYANESTGIATGMLISALHNAGLATLTHTPSPMAFLNSILGRPENERPFLLLVVGYPSADAHVPAFAARRKALDQIAAFV